MTKHESPLEDPQAYISTSSHAHTPEEPVRIRLREYQEDCIRSVLSYLDKGHKRLGISLATGSGKTVIFTQLIDRVPPTPQDGTQTLILVHRRELVEQAYRHCRDAYPSKTIDIEMGTSHATGVADITVASVRSLCSADRIAKFDPERFKLVLVDEAHHIVAPGYMDTLRHFGLLDPTDASPALVGVSATMSRFDGMRLGAAIDHLVYHKDYVDMIGEKWLSNVIFTTVQSKADVSRVRAGANGDFQSGELSRAVNTDQANDITVRAWLARAGNRRSTIAFCVDIAHVVDLTNTFRKHGVDARFVTGETPKIDRGQRLDGFRAGEFPVLVNCGVFTEGTDVPNIDCVLLARPTKSRNLLVQMIGRGMRLFSGKENCHVIDMVASLATGIVTTPTLFGLDPAELVQEANVEEMKAIGDGKKGEGRRAEELGGGSPEHLKSAGSSRSITFTDYDSVFDLIEDTSGERHIRAISPLAWVQVAPERYVLSTKTGDVLTIEEMGEKDYEVRLTRKVLGSGPRQSPFMRPRKVASTETFQDAVHAADTFATKTFPYHSIHAEQGWRKAAASAAQVAFLNKLRPSSKPLQPTDITKGRAGDMITKIKHGAKGRFGKIEAETKRRQRVKTREEKAESVRMREDVRVGPLLG
ncbi:MAG: hypothetical protein M1832_001958 [Thelocarpon impressellum]|nr:MAG: hypothetical protein M1832_001958 [Thelocarpon impressellum]